MKKLTDYKVNFLDNIEGENKMYNKKNQFLKYLNDRVGEILHEIDLLRELISLVESGEFEYKNTNTEEKLDILRGMMRVCETQFEKVKELIEGMRLKNNEQ